MPRLTRRSAASKEEATPEAEENSRTTSRSRRGAKKEEPKQEEVVVGEPQETPTKRGGRQSAKGKQTESKEVTPKKGKSPAGGRSTSRSKKGKQEESEEEPEQEQAEEEVEEEQPAKSGSKSRGRGSKGAAKGGRASGIKAEEEKKETDEVEDEKEEDTSDTAVKTSASKNKGKPATSTRGSRKSRGKAGTEPAEEEKEETKDEDSKGEKEESETVADTDVSTEPKGRQRRGQTQTPESVSNTPPSGGRRGRGQKQAESSSKTPPSRSSRRGAASAAEDESKQKEEVEEPMETTEESKPSEESKPQEDTSELKEAEEEPNKKRKLDEEEDDRQVKRSKTEEEENVEESKEEDLADFVVVNKEEVPPPESKEVLDSLPPPVSSESEPSKPAEDEPKLPSADVVSPVETSDGTFVVPLTEAELAKQYSQQQKQQDVDETSSTLVEVGSEAASDITGLSRGLDFSDTVSQDASVTAELSDQPMEDVSAEDPQNSLDKDGEESKEAVEKQPSVESDSTDTAVDQNSGSLDRYTPSSPDILNRKFILNPLIPPDLMDPAYCFSIVSYNILADCHLQRGDYSYRKPQFLEQDYRHFVLMKEMDYLDGDVVCMQEVNPKYYQDILLPAMASRGYEGSFMKRTKDYWNEGAATFVRKSKFTVISSQGLSLRDLAYKAVDSFNLTADVSEAAKKYLDRADVVLLTQVKLNKTSQVITVCNIHVVYDIHALDVQCIQVACAIKELVSKAGIDLNPHIICGDFNSLFSSPGYQLARDGYLVDSNIKKLQAIQALELADDSTSKALVNHMWGAFQHTSSNLQSAYQVVMSREPLCTTYTKSSYGTLDYIFYSSLSLNVIGVLETVDDYVVRNSGGLPTSSIPSDHLSLKAVFRPREEKN